MRPPSDSLVPTLYALMYSLSVLATLLVFLRIYCRARIIHSVTTDDYLILVSLIQAWGLVITIHGFIKHGYGEHQGRMTPAEIYDAKTPVLKLWYIYNLQYLFILFFVKASILFLYHRLTPADAHRRVIYLLGAFVTITSLVFIILNIFECTPHPSAAWSQSFSPGKNGCRDLVITQYSMAGFNIATDLAIFLLPIPTVWRLDINRRKRGALLIIFSVGSIAVIASIVRLHALYKFQLNTKSRTDTPYVGGYLLLWSIVEVNLAIASASATCLKPLFSSILGGSSVARYYSRSRSRFSGTLGGHGIEQGQGGGGRGSIQMSKVFRPRGTKGSEEGLAEEEMVGILRTTEVDVRVEDAFAGGGVNKGVGTFYRG